MDTPFVETLVVLTEECAHGRSRFEERLLEVQRAPNPPEFAQPRLSRVKRRSSPARGYKFGCVCSYMAGITQV